MKAMAPMILASFIFFTPLHFAGSRLARGAIEPVGQRGAGDVERSCQLAHGGATSAQSACHVRHHLGIVLGRRTNCSAPALCTFHFLGSPIIHRRLLIRTITSASMLVSMRAMKSGFMASAWRNSSNSLACCSGVMPMPVSATGMTDAEIEVHFGGLISYVIQTFAPIQSKLSATASLTATRERWPRLSEQFLRIDKWSVCRG
jgi:hypothetical protein